LGHLPLHFLLCFFTALPCLVFRLSFSWHFNLGFSNSHAVLFGNTLKLDVFSFLLPTLWAVLIHLP
jgi:hypothetical protein